MYYLELNSISIRNILNIFRKMKSSDAKMVSTCDCDGGDKKF
jgi:hypothetical protein